MPKRRLPLTKNKKKKIPETADEFLNGVGVEYEESGDRWRPGDKSKAGRFYAKAIESYEAALQRNPSSFDAAYNCARLQYQLAQSPELLSQPHITLRPLLQKVLQSHRHCLKLNPENEDALFNTGQVLCSSAEVLVEYRNAPTEAKTEAAQLLSEAVEIFQKCLALQEIRYASETGQNPQNQRVSGDVRIGGGERETSSHFPMGAGDENEDEDEQMGESEQWATVQTPITKDQLLDTGLAGLGACTTLCPLATEGLGRPLVWVQDIANSLLKFRITPLSQDTGRQDEISLARANFSVALAEASFKSDGATDPATWEASIRAAFGESPRWNVSTYFQALCDKADAHIQLATIVTEQGTKTAPTLAWKHYAFAAQSLSSAAGLEPLKAEINIARGDVDILRAKIEIPVAIQSRGLLLKNAGVYYRGARKLEGGNERVKSEAMVKEAMVEFEMGSGEFLKGITLDRVIKDIVIDAVDEGIFGPEWLDRVALALNITMSQ